MTIWISKTGSTTVLYPAGNIAYNAKIFIRNTVNVPVNINGEDLVILQVRVACYSSWQQLFVSVSVVSCSLCHLFVPSPLQDRRAFLPQDDWQHSDRAHHYRHVQFGRWSKDVSMHCVNCCTKTPGIVKIHRN